MFAIVDEVDRIEVVRVPLAVVPEEPVKALRERVAGGPFAAEPPLAECPRHIALSFQQLSKCHFLSRDRFLAAEDLRNLIGLGDAVLQLPVVADVRMTGMLAGHQHAA